MWPVPVCLGLWVGRYPWDRWFSQLKSGKGDKWVCITVLSLQLIVCMTMEHLPNIAKHWSYHLKNVDKNPPWDNMVISVSTCISCNNASKMIGCCSYCSCLYGLYTFLLIETIHECQGRMSSGYPQICTINSELCVCSQPHCYLLPGDYHLNSEFPHKFPGIWSVLWIAQPSNADTPPLSWASVSRPGLILRNTYWKNIVCWPSMNLPWSLTTFYL